MGWKINSLFCILIFIFLIGCAAEPEQQNIETIKEEPQEVVDMKLMSPAFNEGGEIPSEYTCDGSDVSPELKIEDIPENTKSLAIIMDDPDAPMRTFVHWVVWNIPRDKSTIAKGETTGIQGSNNFGKTGYGGPCPPAKHRYFFKLYALDTELDLEEGASKKDLENAMKGHILADAELMGTYERQ